MRGGRGQPIRAGGQVRTLAEPATIPVAGVAFAVLLALVPAGWSPLQRFDAATIDALNAAVSGRPSLVSALHVVTDLGGAHAAWGLVSVTVVWLLVRGAPRLATYAAR